MDPLAISSLGVPVLCIDTCSILDIMRDPTREGAKPHERQAAIDLVTHAEAGRLVCIVAQQGPIGRFLRKTTLSENIVRTFQAPQSLAALMWALPPLRRALRSRFRSPFWLCKT